ncbi:hypothetical protein PHLGIDRAFT_492165 [Phlebiopsis gigantea 11061_1 CR5-6]|uniref:AAA+ ATPase domain-containing protein n=1 Tax=Phlebiopsis gigantea (strain 11061_1 CR5-6) TaxID=745531 RepID=A0A0C3S7S2_PHLG1|nr:hypothetical protein PHLGIDRAFT_492165 [Phlebiopsis gigantea 11061_1 CR5-6]
MSLVRTGSIGSLILWGPPGCGKTTLARLLAKAVDAAFRELSATDSGISDIRTVAEEAKGLVNLTGRRTILFLDEVHRFNRAQQVRRPSVHAGTLTNMRTKDIFLPYIEQGIIQLIGATTENPSFKLNGALLSRCRVIVLERLTDDDIRQIVTRAVRRVSPQAAPSDADPAPLPVDASPPSSPTLVPSQGLSQPSSEPAPSFPAFPHLTPKVLSTLISLSTGDARTALSLLELALASPPHTEPERLLSALRRSVSTAYDRTGDDRYDMISALHKSVRGSDGSAALYWLARMLTAGEDPVYVARRMAVCASEDVGLADNHALPLAMATLQACQNIGMPECRINLAHLVTYLAEAPKSTRAYEAYTRAETAAKADPTLPVPPMVRNAPTTLMKDLGYGDGYAYNPNYIHPVTNQYLPPSLQNEVFLRPTGDTTDKIWDEAMLKRWEEQKNGGRPWPNRQDFAD